MYHLIMELESCIEKSSFFLDLTWGQRQWPGAFWQWLFMHSILPRTQQILTYLTQDWVAQVSPFEIQDSFKHNVGFQ